jgi:hypothetical protein
METYEPFTIVLNNGNLLTHNQNFDNVQIWDATTLQCIKEWSWYDTQLSKQCLSSIFKLRAFPDSVHLLVFNDSNCYLFNTIDLTSKLCKLDTKLTDFGYHHILPNGQVIVYTGYSYNEFQRDVIARSVFYDEAISSLLHTGHFTGLLRCARNDKFTQISTIIYKKLLSIKTKSPDKRGYLILNKRLAMTDFCMVDPHYHRR